MRPTVEIRKLNSEHMIDGSDDGTRSTFYSIFFYFTWHTLTMSRFFLRFIRPALTYSQQRQSHTFTHTHTNAMNVRTSRTHYIRTMLTTPIYSRSIPLIDFICSLLARMLNAVIDHDSEHDRTARRHSFCCLFRFFYFIFISSVVCRSFVHSFDRSRVRSVDRLYAVSVSGENEIVRRRSSVSIQNS